MDFSNIENIFQVSSAESLKYKPIKIVRKVITPKLDALLTQQVTVFVGNPSKDVKNILQKMEKNPKLIPSDQESNLLKKEFGSEFAKLLHLSKPRSFTQKGGGKGNEDEDEDEDEDVDILSEEDVEENEDEMDADIDIDIDLEKELESSASSASTRKETMPFGLKYIYDYINIDDEIDTIKRKIEIHLRIPIEAQHNWYTFKKGTSKFIKLLDYQCRTIINESVSQLFPVTIDTILSKSHSSGSKKVLGLAVDSDFIRKYKQKSQLHILNFTNNILGDKYYTGFEQKSTINVLSLYDVITNIGIGKIQSLRNEEYTKYESLYYGLVLKFWPMVKLTDFSSILTRSQFPSVSSNIKIYEKMYSEKQYYINLINSIDSKDIYNAINLNSGITGFDFTINKNFANLFGTDILKLSDIFNGFNVTEEVPFISYFTHGMKKSKYKINTKDESEYFSEYQVQKWTQTTSTGITFKIRMVLNRENPLFDSSYMTVDLNSKGKFNVKTTWKEGYGQDVFDHINLHSFYSVINNLIVTINKNSPKSAFIKNIKIPEIDAKKTNINFQFVNFFSRIKFKSPGASLNYKILRVLTNVFRSHVREARPKKSRRSQTQNEAKIGYIRKSKYHKFPKSKQLNQFWIDQSKINATEPKAIYTHVSEAVQNEPKISISGIKDFDEFKYVYDFLVRLVYLSLELKTFFQKPGTEQLKDDYKKLTIRDKDKPDIQEKYVETYYATKKKELAEGRKKSSIDPKTGKISTKYKKIKLLKSYNNKLFGYKKTDKYESYSRLCQNEKQPIPMTDDELKQFKNNSTEKYVSVKYPSDSTDTSVQPVNYVCVHDLYKYPGFISPDKHPTNHCLPCCFINDSISNPRSKNAKTYNMCLGKDNEAQSDIQREISQKYIKQYTKFIVDGRLSNPPFHLNRFLNETKISKDGKVEFKGERRSRRSIYETDRKNPPTYLLLGTPQHNRAFLTAVETALDITRGKMLTDLTEALKKNQTVFGTLSGGRLKRRFGTLDNFIEYIQNPSNPLTPREVEDLIIRLNDKFPDNLRIHILYEDENGAIQLRCSLKFTSKSSDKGGKHVVIFSTGQYYYPIVLVGNPEKPRQVEKVFSTDSNGHKIIVILNDLFEKMCDTSSGVTKSIASKLKYVNLNLTLNDIYALLKKVDNWDIKYQLVNQNNYVIGIVIAPNNSKKTDLFTVPVLLSDPIKGIPLTHNYYYGDWKTVYPFITRISKLLMDSGKFVKHPYNNNTVISKLLVDTTQTYVVGMVLRYKLEMYIKKIPIKGINLNDPNLKHLRYKIQSFNPESVNQLIKDKTVFADKRVTDVIDIKYEQELYDLVKFEVNNILFRERNTHVRTELTKLFNKHPNKKMMDYIESDLPESITIVPEDLSRLKELLRVVQYFAKTNDVPGSVFEQYFKKYTFYFDLMTINKIETLLDKKDINIDKKKDLINSIIEKIMKDTVTITNKDISNKKIKKPCSETNKTSQCQTGYCLWDSKTGKCKVIIESKSVYDNIVSRIVNEIVKNISARNELLKVKLSW
jgi:hypothetical protein